MPTLPASTLALFDHTGAPLGRLRLVCTSETALKGDCIFDIPAPGPGAKNEVRWLYKRRYQRMSEHRFKIDEQGVITVSGPDFLVRFDPDEAAGGFATRPPAPPVTARWAAAEE